MYCLTVKVAPRTKLERTHFSMIATSLRRSLDLQASVIAFWRFRCHRRSHLVNFLIPYQRAEVARKSPFNYFLHYLHHPDKNFLICLLYEFTWCYFLKLATTAGHQSTSWRLLRDHAPGKLIRVLITTHFWKGVAQAVMVNVQAWVLMLILLKRKEASTWKQPRRILFVVWCTQLITTYSCRHVFNAPFLFFYVSWSLFLFTVEKNAKEKEEKHYWSETFHYVHYSQFKLLKLSEYYPSPVIQFCFCQKLDLLLIVWYRIQFWLQITEIDTNDVSLLSPI